MSTENPADSPEKKPVRVKRWKLSRIEVAMLALLFLVNIATALWLHLLPRPDIISQIVLELDAEGNADQLAIQVEIGRGHLQIHEKLIIAANVAKWLLALSTVVLLWVFLKNHAEGPNSKSTLTNETPGG